MIKQGNSKPQTGVAPSNTTGSASLGPAPTRGLATQAAVQDRDAPRKLKSRDGLIVASIVIDSIASSVMCFFQLELSLPISGAAGIVMLALLMLVHKQMQKSAKIVQLKEALAQSLQMAKPKVVSCTTPTTSISPGSTEARIRELSRDIGNLVLRSDMPNSGVPAPALSAVAVELGSDRSVRKLVRAPTQSNAEIGGKPAAEGSVGPTLGPLLAAAAPAGRLQQVPQGEGAQPMRECWAFRPRTDAQASVQVASAATNAVNGAQAPKAPVATTIEGDLELVQRKIKELADEVNAAEALRLKPVCVHPRPKGSSNVLEDSIGALRAVAKSMRERPSLSDYIPKFEAKAFTSQPVPGAAVAPEQPKSGLGELVIPATAERIAGSDFVALPPSLNERDTALPSFELPLPDFAVASSSTSPPRAVTITRAIEDDAMDILLGPIVTLAEHSVNHYEMTTNLHSITGEHLDFNEDDFALIGGELDSQFDIARFNRAAALVARMNARGRDGSLLAEFLGSSMTSRAFLEAFANVYETRWYGFSTQLVLTFSQRAVDAFSLAAWQAVRDVHAFGFRFALDKIRHMGTDFTALQRSGFRFVRFEAQALLEGMATPEQFVPADEILQRAMLAGLTSIATGIQDAVTQKRLLDSGILLGQGPLFGAARQVNVSAAAAGSADHSAAA